jgi:hypothetical protein
VRTFGVRQVFPLVFVVADDLVAKRASLSSHKLARLLPVCVLLVVAGCAGVPEVPPAAPEPEVEEVEPEPPPEPGEQAIPAPVPDPVDPVEPVTEPPAPRVAVVLSERSEAYERVAAEIIPMLDRPLVYNLSDRSLSTADAFLAIADSTVDVVVAIGLRAAEAASQLSPVPVVYCQVFNLAAPEKPAVPFKGVSSLPPLSPQMQAWKQLNPGLGRVGTIIGPGHEGLIDEAHAAAAEHGIDLEHRVAKSDRETLYIFKRMAPAIDGFWLFPDNRVLSAAVLKEILQSAPRYDVQVAVFNAVLLEFGAALSSVSVHSDIAATVVSVAKRLAAGEADPIPALTPLNQIEIRTGSTTAAGPAPAGPATGPGPSPARRAR